MKYFSAALPLFITTVALGQTLDMESSPDSSDFDDFGLAPNYGLISNTLSDTKFCQERCSS